MRPKGGPKDQLAARQRSLTCKCLLMSFNLATMLQESRRANPDKPLCYFANTGHRTHAA
ncbi:hypothetical protein GCM10010377_23840 [Streptomyces viridiviolaceus]|nr:hypothetical protein GCM10010377_23840 [Streptomyces viridiviolaceus]